MNFGDSQVWARRTPGSPLGAIEIAGSFSMHSPGCSQKRSEGTLRKCLMWYRPEGSKQQTHGGAQNSATPFPPTSLTGHIFQSTGERSANTVISRALVKTHCSWGKGTTQQQQKPHSWGRGRSTCWTQLQLEEDEENWEGHRDRAKA